MKKLMASALTLLTICGGSLFAGQSDCCYENDCGYNDCCGSWSVYVDYLYWHVCLSDINFTTGNQTKYVNPDYDSGWRIGGLYRNGAWDVGFRYTDFCTSDSNNGNRFKFEWDVLDIELGYSLCFDCYSFLFRPFVGAKFAWIDDSYAPTGDDVAKQDFNGYGLYFGTEARYMFCKRNVCCSELETSLVFRGSYGILDGNSDTRQGSNNRDDECIFISTVEVFAGLDFGYQCSTCFTPHLLIGYEAHQYGGWREASSSNHIASLGLGGLVVRFRADF